MALSITATGNTSGLIPGFGFEAAVTIAWDAAYPAGGEACDLSGIFPNEVYGGHQIADTQDDAPYLFSYVRAAAGAPATGVIQVYLGEYTNANDGALIEATGANLLAVDGQRWMFYGR